METVIVHLDDGSALTGVVVVIDVIRPFTSAAHALDRGARQIFLVEHVSDAFALRERDSRALLMGENEGVKVPGFDYGNSPSLLPPTLEGKTLIQRTSAGTKGVVRAGDAEVCLAASPHFSQQVAEMQMRRCRKCVIIEFPDKIVDASNETFA